jgi:hypothetical protein
MAQRTAHVWVRKSHDPTPRPGLVLSWRRDTTGGWEALVTYLERPVVDQPQAITEWISADRLIPVEWRPGIGSAYG